MKIFLVSLLCFVVCVLFPGCGNKYGLCEVEGVVTLNGKPLPHVSVNFMPTNGGRASSGATDTQGHFVMYYTNATKGVEPGEHKVALIPFPVLEEMSPTDPEVVKYLENYGEINTPLTFTVEKSNLEFSINLP